MHISYIIPLIVFCPWKIRGARGGRKENLLASFSPLLLLVASTLELFSSLSLSPLKVKRCSLRERDRRIIVLCAAHQLHLRRLPWQTRRFFPSYSSSSLCVCVSFVIIYLVKKKKNCYLHVFLSEQNLYKENNKLADFAFEIEINF